MLLFALGYDLLVQIIVLYHLLRYLDEARFQLPQLLDEQQFDALKVFLLVGKPERELLELLVEELLLELDLTDQLVLQGDQLRVNLQVDDHSFNLLLELLAELCFPTL